MDESSINSQRRAALRARRALEPGDARAASRQACRRIARLPEFRHARRIGLYWPMPSEADPRPLLDVMPHGRQALLPRVAGARLVFIAVGAPGFRRRRSGLGVFEPIGGRARAVTALDLLILPLAGFDGQANRIGLGGGYYDRTLSTCRVMGDYRGPRLVGLAFEAQRLSRIEPRPWDVALDAIVTEAGVYSRARARATRAGEAG